MLLLRGCCCCAPPPLQRAHLLRTHNNAWRPNLHLTLEGGFRSTAATCRRSDSRSVSPQPLFGALAVLCSEFASSRQHPPLQVEGTDGRVESGGDAEAERALGLVAAASAPSASTLAANASAVARLGRCKGLEGCDASGRTALHVAAGGGVALTAVLAAAAAAAEEEEEVEAGEGMAAVVEAVRLLLCAGASVRARDTDGATPLHAVRRNACSTCLRRGEEPFQTRMVEGRGCDSLIASGGRVGVLYVSCGQAAAAGHVAAVRALLAAGADATAVDKQGRTPARVAGESRSEGLWIGINPTQRQGTAMGYARR
jgi:hypothetical protein